MSLFYIYPTIMYPHRVSWVEIGSTKYCKGRVVVLESHLLPIFGIIVDIVIHNSDHYLVCDTLHTECFVPHYHAYEVTKKCTSDHVICTHDDLVDPHVLGLYTLPSHSSYFVPMKYYIVENFNFLYLHTFYKVCMNIIIHSWCISHEGN